MNTQIMRRPALAGRLERRLAETPSRLRRALHSRARITRITRELEAHSDRGLADLGIARCDIRRIARETVHGR